VNFDSSSRIWVILTLQHLLIHTKSA